MENDDDEITIDFSKIKNFFKRKTEKRKVEEVKKDTEEVKQKLVREDQRLAQDETSLENIEKEIEAQELKAEQIDRDTDDIEREIKQEKAEIQRIRDDVEREPDEEVSIDFSKIKRFFSGFGKGAKKEQPGSDDDISFDYQKIIEYTKKYHVLLIVLIPLLISIYLRAMPAYLPITGEWARSTVENNIRQQISSEIRRQYPNLPEANINQLVENQFQQFIKQNKAEIENQVSQLSDYFKSRLQKEGQTYLIAIDPYFWMRHARNVLENGHPGDELRDINTGELCEERSKECVPWDNHMLAPMGRSIPSDMFHAYFEAYFHKFLTIFNPDQDIMASCFFVPVLLSALAIIPAFFIARRIGGNFGGFIAALLIAIHPAFLSRTVGGFADTDAYNVLLPLFIIWLFLEAFESRKSLKTLILSGISGALVGIYTKVWSGWWYIFDFVIATVIAYLVIYILIHRDDLKKLKDNVVIRHTALAFIVFFVSAMIFTMILANFGTFSFAFLGPTDFMRFKEVGIRTVWPNVFTTVAEQNPASLNKVVNQIGTGSLILFLMSITGIILTLVSKDSKKMKDLIYAVLSVIWLMVIMVIRPQNLMVFLSLISLPIIVKIIIAIYSKNAQIDFKLAIILIIWFTATLYASTKGIRYMILLVPAFALGLGICFGMIYKYLSGVLSDWIDIDKIIVKTVVLALLMILIVAVPNNPWKTARATAKEEIPSMNGAWYESLDKINREAEPDAIINSWWDFGHWFKAIGDRAVTFDGTSQNTPMAHWVGHTLLTDDEAKAVGILRMLDCGSNSAFRRLNEEINDTSLGVQVLHQIAKMDRSDARDYLLGYVDKTAAEEILAFSHCEPPEDYYITSDDMIGKSSVWAHFGSWDFDRATIYNTLKTKAYMVSKEKAMDYIIDRFNYSESTAENIFYEVQGISTSEEANSWIAPWPSYASGEIGCTEEDGLIKCPFQAQGSGGRIYIYIDMENKQAEIRTPSGIVYPNAIAYPTKEGFGKMEFSNNTIGYSMTLIPSQDGWKYIMVLPPLEDSMFTRLYFLDGHGLTKFRKFSEERSITGNRIIVWKVDWEGDEMNVMDYFKEKNDSIESESLLEETELEGEISPDTESESRKINTSLEDSVPAAEENASEVDSGEIPLVIETQNSPNETDVVPENISSQKISNSTND